MWSDSDLSWPLEVDDALTNEAVLLRALRITYVFSFMGPRLTTHAACGRHVVGSAAVCVHWSSGLFHWRISLDISLEFTRAGRSGWAPGCSVSPTSADDVESTDRSTWFDWSVCEEKSYHSIFRPLFKETGECLYQHL